MTRQAEFSKPARGLVVRSAEGRIKFPSLPPGRLEAAIQALIKGAK